MNTATTHDDSMQCPGCRADFPARAVVCVQCGYDRRTALQHQGVEPTQDDEPADPLAGWATAGLFTRARMILLVFCVGLPGAGFFTVVCFMAAGFDPRLTANQRVGFGLAGVGCLIMFTMIGFVALRMILGPRRWLCRVLQRMKWLAAGVVLTFVALLAWAYFAK